MVSTTRSCDDHGPGAEVDAVLDDDVAVRGTGTASPNPVAQHVAHLEAGEHLVRRGIHHLKVAAVEPGAVAVNERRLEPVALLDGPVQWT